MIPTKGKGRIERDFKLNKSGRISRYSVAKIGIAVLEKGIGKNKTFEILKGEILIEKWFA